MERRVPRRPARRPGEAQWIEHGRPIDHFVGTYRDGKREGAGYYKWNDTVSFEGSYANDVPQGRGTLRIDDVVLTGEWSKGCLRPPARSWRSAVPRLSCGPGRQPPKPKWPTAD